jgi:uncharacterized protein YbjT (DUF2867 family)
MKIVVIGGTGLIGSKLVTVLRRRGHEVMAASPDSGVNALTGEGLPTALAALHAVLRVHEARCRVGSPRLGAMRFEDWLNRAQ